MAATARDSSCQRARRTAWTGVSWRRASSRATRIAHTATSGTTPTRRTRGSAMSIQVSSNPTATGTYQRAGHRSMTSQVSRSGTAVPMWPRDSSRTKTPTPS